MSTAHNPKVQKQKVLIDCRVSELCKKEEKMRKQREFWKLKFLKLESYSMQSISKKKLQAKFTFYNLVLFPCRFFVHLSRLVFFLCHGMVIYITCFKGCDVVTRRQRKQRIPRNAPKRNSFYYKRIKGDCWMSKFKECVGTWCAPLPLFLLFIISRNKISNS